MTDDIVARLRYFNRQLVMEIEDGYHGENGADWVIEFACISEAADEIERLRAERDGYLEGNRMLLASLAEANDIAKKYKIERDGARRWICQLLANPTIAKGLASPCRGTPRDYAGEQGWDCFTEAR